MALTQVQGGMIVPSTTLTTPIVATTMGVGGATPASSGSGITFPATQSASTDANTLDDYEEGTFTPNIGGNATYNSQLGNYIKVGRMVYVELYLSINTLGTGSPSQIYGLPFSSPNESPLGGVAIPYYAGINTALVFIGGYKNSNDASIIFIGNTAASVTSTNAPSVFKSGASVYASVVYRSVS